ncbi:MAG: hypothetical protein HKN90_00310 [Flavobacteriaceae bacterium]|nr:hypothetical protein [Flavobacteriaceae bacterium]
MSTSLKNKRPYVILTIVAVLLIIPLILTNISDQVNWSLFDFILMAALLGFIGVSVELILRYTKNTIHRVILFLAVLIFFLLLWAELAVGVLGTPFAGS